jgi:hypothetical protein
MRLYYSLHVDSLTKAPSQRGSWVAISPAHMGLLICLAFFYSQKNVLVEVQYRTLRSTAYS